jgi:23S rRNA maturation-related 3'-5' exoribonuclease YhaM
MTSTEKETKIYYSFEFKNKKISVILSQIRLFDAKRMEMSKKYGKVSPNDFQEISKKLKVLLFEKK